MLTKCARDHGMLTLQHSGWEKVKAGYTTLDELLRVITVHGEMTTRQDRRDQEPRLDRTKSRNTTADRIQTRHVRTPGFGSYH